jgi:hypothetical protein
VIRNGAILSAGLAIAALATACLPTLSVIAPPRNANDERSVSTGAAWIQGNAPGMWVGSVEYVGPAPAISTSLHGPAAVADAANRALFRVNFGTDQAAQDDGAVRPTVDLRTGIRRHLIDTDRALVAVEGGGFPAVVPYEINAGIGLTLYAAAIASARSGEVQPFAAAEIAVAGLALAGKSARSLTGVSHGQLSLGLSSTLGPLSASFLLGVMAHAQGQRLEPAGVPTPSVHGAFDLRWFAGARIELSR